MTALVADAIIPSKGAEHVDVRSYLVADNVKIFKGAIVARDTNGYANVGADTAAFFTLGIAVEQADNTVAGHTPGGIRVRVASAAHFLLPGTGLAQANVTAPVNIADSGAVTLTGTNTVRVGRITEFVSATAAWVYVPTPGSN
jgi:hypothetical protein